METTSSAKRPRGHVQEQVFDRLRRGLMVGAFMPGQVMSLRKLAANFGTSPMPVREALTRLVMTNALEAMESGSVRVPRMTLSRLGELFAIREQLEGMAAEQACRKCTPSLISSLEAVNERLMRAIEKRQLLDCLAMNQRFHFMLYEASGSEVLLPLIESLWLQFGPTMYLSLLSPDTPWDASAHATVLEGLRTRKPAMTKRGVIDDVRGTGQTLESALSSPQPLAALDASLSDLYFAT